MTDDDGFMGSCFVGAGNGIWSDKLVALAFDIFNAGNQADFWNKETLFARCVCDLRDKNVCRESSDGDEIDESEDDTEFRAWQSKLHTFPFHIEFIIA